MTVVHRSTIPTEESPVFLHYHPSLCSGFCTLLAILEVILFPLIREKNGILKVSPRLSHILCKSPQKTLNDNKGILFEKNHIFNSKLADSNIFFFYFALCTIVIKNLIESTCSKLSPCYVSYKYQTGVT